MVVDKRIFLKDKQKSVVTGGPANKVKITEINDDDRRQEMDTADGKRLVSSKRHGKRLARNKSAVA